MEHEAPAFDRAEEGFRKALALAEQLGMRPLQAHCHLGLGRLYQRRGDREAAAAISAARDLFRAMDMTYWLRDSE
jgi:lipopolysaccharide biosynthesis regulator YciM